MTSRRSKSKRPGGGGGASHRGKLSSVEEESSVHSIGSMSKSQHYGNYHSRHHVSSPPKIDLKKEYTRFCKLYSSEPLEIVSTPLERASFGRDPTVVDLKGRGLRGVDCIALGKILASDAPIHHLNLSDCLLLPQGFEVLNSHVKAILILTIFIRVKLLRFFCVGPSGWNCEEHQASDVRTSGK